MQTMDSNNKKTGPSDGSEMEVEEISSDEKMRKEDEKFQEYLDRIKKERELEKEKRKEKLKKLRKDLGIDKKEKRKLKEETNKKMIAGQKVAGRSKVFKLKHKTEVFRHNVLHNFRGVTKEGNTRIEMALKKLHGVPSEKKRNFIEALKAYNQSSLLRKEDVKDFAIRLKHKRYSGPRFKKVDVNSLKSLTRREINKIRRAITGEEDPLKYVRRKGWSVPERKISRNKTP